MEGGSGVAKAHRGIPGEGRRGEGVDRAVSDQVLRKLMTGSSEKGRVSTSVVGGSGIAKGHGGSWRDRGGHSSTIGHDRIRCCERTRGLRSMDGCLGVRTPHPPQRLTRQTNGGCASVPDRRAWARVAHARQRRATKYTFGELALPQTDCADPNKALTIPPVAFVLHVCPGLRQNGRKRSRTLCTVFW